MGVFCVVRHGGVCGIGLQRGIGFGGMGCRIFDGRVGRHEFAMGVGSFLHGYMRCGIGEHWGGMGLANLGQLHGNVQGRSQLRRTMSWFLHVAVR